MCPIFTSIFDMKLQITIARKEIFRKFQKPLSESKAQKASGNGPGQIGKIEQIRPDVKRPGRRVKQRIQQRQSGDHCKDQERKDIDPFILRFCKSWVCHASEDDPDQKVNSICRYSRGSPGQNHLAVQPGPDDHQYQYNDRSCK